jgi:ribokinase
LLPFAALTLEVLEVAGRALESREPPRTAAAALEPSPPVDRSDRRGRADDASDEKRPDTASPLFAFHVRILECAPMLVCALGDLTLDVAVQLGGPIAVGGDADAEIRLAPGGQAANVAAWAAALGASARFVGKRGSDEAGVLARSGLERLGIDVLGPEEGWNGVVCALVSPGGERSMATDRAAAAALRPEEIEDEWFDGCDHLFVSGYALLHEPVRSAARRAAEMARREGSAISVDLSSWSALQTAGVEDFRTTVAELHPDVIFGNERENEIFGDPLPGVRWIVKRGARGCSFDGEERAARAVEHVVDTTGAGDALAAGWIAGGPDLALDAAARCVQQLGSMPIGSSR